MPPGNHGWPHYTGRLHDLTVCANVIDPSTGTSFFRPLHLAELSGRALAITAVIGPDAFASIAPDLRAGQRVTDPARALHQLHDQHHQDVDAWVLLSHHGYRRDPDLAGRCPFLDLVFSGYCHSADTGPEEIGTTTLVKAPEFGRGIATARLHPGGWTTAVEPTASLPFPAELDWATEAIGEAEKSLDEVVGQPSSHWKNRTFSPEELLRRVAARLRRQTGLGVILNTNAITPRPLGDVLTRRELIEPVPYDNRPLHTGPSATAHSRPVQDLFEGGGSLVIRRAGTTRPAPHYGLPGAAVRSHLSVHGHAEPSSSGGAHHGGRAVRQSRPETAHRPCVLTACKATASRPDR
ncbi:bifunctional metallophosphatase/5'-nucleotidase [Streptomyces sp. NPDC018947]|uniref:bifunctional metallophosphatase/5'-nucleotidase n=1 Tax=Streptomyces sp. NPDC018947 TaxID=3365054 RepID=UPI0037B25C10